MLDSFIVAAPLILNEASVGVGFRFRISTFFVPVRVTPLMVWVAETDTVVSPLTAPAVSKPEPEIVVALEFSDQAGDTF